MNVITFTNHNRPYFFYLAQYPHPFQWAMASTFTRLLDHTQRRSTVGRTPLDEGSASRRDFYLTAQHSQQTNILALGGIRTHNPSRRAAADIGLTPCDHWDRHDRPYSVTYIVLNIAVVSLFQLADGRMCKLCFAVFVKNYLLTHFMSLYLYSLRWNKRMFSCAWRTLEVQYGDKVRNGREVTVQFLGFCKRWGKTLYEIRRNY
jgi:hypothetical protein